MNQNNYAMRREIAVLQSVLDNPGLEPTARSYIQTQIANLEIQRKRL
jgi:hypothetical protein